MYLNLKINALFRNQAYKNQPKVFHIAFLYIVNSKFIQVILLSCGNHPKKYLIKTSEGNCNMFKVIVKANILRGYLPSILICAVKIYIKITSSNNLTSPTPALYCVFLSSSCYIYFSQLFFSFVYFSGSQRERERGRSE